MSTQPSTAPPTTTSIKKGSSDWRTYNHHRLPNGITLIVVNDPQSKTTAMSCCVNVGASSDPRSLAGLAHFCEHMCFLGSERYPGENEYKRYLSLHGGRSNASTSMHHTTYQFDVLAPHALTAIDIFSNFFTCPLFSSSGTSRELRAVDSENSKNISNDARRRLQILKSLGDDKHEYTKFSTGDEGTLRGGDEGVREALITFHRRHYHPENMTVVIVGPQESHVLEKWARERFETVTNRWVEKEVYEGVEQLIHEAAVVASTEKDEKTHRSAFYPALQGGTWPVLVTTLPLRDVRKLVLMFPVPPVYDNPDRNPVRLLSHLIGHEGRGSIFAHLQNLGLITSLSAGSRINDPTQCLFQIDLSLTPTGETQWNTTIIPTIFSYCRLILSAASLAQRGDAASMMLDELRRIWEEKAQMARIDFDFSSPGMAYSFAPRLARSVTMNGVENCLAAGSMLEESAETLPLEELLEYAKLLTPENCIVERCSKTAWKEQVAAAAVDKTDDGIFGLKKEKWYGVEYYLSQMNPEDVKSWSQDEASSSDHNRSLHLPQPNDYIPQNLNLHPDLPTEAHTPHIDWDVKPPTLLFSHPHNHYRLWHKLDDRYALPQSSLTLLLRTPFGDHTPKKIYSPLASLHTSLLLSTFSDAMAQETYAATLAGCHFNLSHSSFGFQLSCGGYSDRLTSLALSVMKEFKKGDFVRDEMLVSAAKDRLVRSLTSFLKSGRVDSHAGYYTNLLLSGRDCGSQKVLTLEEKAQMVKEDINMASLQKHFEMIVGSVGGKESCCWECLFMGNVSEMQAREFWESVEDIWGKRGRGMVAAGEKEDDQEGDTKNMAVWMPGPFERRLPPSQTLSLHFPSQNPSEENGAVLLTFQSPVPGFRGHNFPNNHGNLHPTQKSLTYTSAIRLLCHMLREPLFDELRTKQQLGYIVNSYYNVDYHTEYIDHDSNTTAAAPTTTTIDSIVITIVSKTLSPPLLTQRVDDFLHDFRHTLTQMPRSEIRDHGDALAKKLSKPVQKLGDEASRHLGRIRRYAPEILLTDAAATGTTIQQHNGGGDVDSQLPWDNVMDVADCVKKLEKGDLLEVWDAIMTEDAGRSRVVSHVYGNKFPLTSTSSNKTRTEAITNEKRQWCFDNTTNNNRKTTEIRSLDDLINLRRSLVTYTPKNISPLPPPTSLKNKYNGSITILGRLYDRRWRRSSSATAAAAAALVGVGVLSAVGLYMISSSSSSSKTSPAGTTTTKDGVK